jgi:hypothetical protein
MKGLPPATWSPFPVARRKGAGDLCCRAISSFNDPGIVVHGVALKPGKPLCLVLAAATSRACCYAGARRVRPCRGRAGSGTKRAPSACGFYSEVDFFADEKRARGPASASDSTEPSQVRTRLSAGASRIRTLGPTPSLAGSPADRQLGPASSSHPANLSLPLSR